MTALNNTYALNNVVRCSVAFTVSGVATNPTATTFTWKTPAGTITTYTYGTDSQLVRDSTGNFHVDLPADTAGSWFYEFKGTGTCAAAAEDKFFVQPTDVA